ncbi:MAG: alkaline phosphatase family protein [Desulfobulbaceae bacterium]|jgi:2,3-bisphosphoglycerate-independent phosphoglycerate mutase|nr:alkaline phosphatase family protein [Desulfobulbaceae bacterium]
MVTRCILILLDGLGDRTHPELNNKTPLMAAHTPNLDQLASLGANGLMQVMEPGRAQPSENAHFALFGYSPAEFPGRGLLEAMGAGITVNPGEVALLAHFVSLQEKDGLLLLGDHPQANPEEISQLVKAINGHGAGDIKLRFHPSSGLYGILLMSGLVSPEITDTNPLRKGEPLMESMAWQTSTGVAKESAQAINGYLAWCYHTLAHHEINLTRRRQGKAPINGLVSQRPGQLRSVEPFSERWGLKGLSISSGLMYWGLAEFLGLEVTKVRDSGNPGVDLAQRLQLALTSDYDFIHVHTKAPDEAAHTKNPLNKMAAIESLDQGLGRVMNDLLDEETMVVITADHSTPSAGPQVHSGEPVPITVVGPGIRRDLVQRFDEIHCAGGALGTARGEDFMYLVLNWLDRAKLQGLRDCSHDRPYWPGQRQPLRLDRLNGGKR